MTEILTESFCERCGTRYTFESARPKPRLKGVRVLSRGLKNFVLSDDTSMDEAMAAARNETDRESTAHQLDAFHKTFNFCMSCRQYTCPNCWNDVEARCLSCAPHLGHDVLPAPFPDLPTGPLVHGDAASANGLNGSNGAGHAPELIGLAEVQSTGDEPEVDPIARLAALTAPIATPTTEVHEVAAAAEPVTPELVDEPEIAVAPKPVTPEASTAPAVETAPEASARPAIEAAPEAAAVPPPDPVPAPQAVTEPTVRKTPAAQKAPAPIAPIAAADIAELGAGGASHLPPMVERSTRPPR